MCSLARGQSDKLNECVYVCKFVCGVREQNYKHPVNPSCTKCDIMVLGTIRPILKEGSTLYEGARVANVYGC